ncbi:unnamed protein product [Mesocestoides corti]|uniref:NADP-dependent oxidoreductase domain-containing protein n=2 Tax=Mesocestoides corti TaxID=53468 RepID=A0A0R3UA71_MESCO|nr:unnamed protein product [Mesocestoides corti]
MLGLFNVILNNGNSMPSLVFGTSDPENAVGDAVVCAIETGYRHIDCAMFYKNEEEVGAAISKCLTSQNLKREDLFITSKLWCDSHKPDDVRPACELSIQKLGLDYLDLYLVHWPVSFHAKPGRVLNVDDPDTIEFEEHPLEKTWKAMESLVSVGLVKSIGVSNFNRKQLDRIMKICTIPPAVNQIEVSLNCMNTKLIEYCHSKGIQVEAYAPIGSPGFAKGTIPSLLEEPFVKEIADAHKKTTAQILLRHALQRGLAVICKSITNSRIKSNFEVTHDYFWCQFSLIMFDFELTDAEMMKLNTSGRNARIFRLLAFDMPAMSSITLNSGFKIPSLGFGTFAVSEFTEQDYTLYCAMVYDNEEEVGSGISKALLSEGLSRKDLFITSKLWCDKHSPKDVRPACEQSLKRLGLEYLDLYLVHFPTAFHAKPSMTFNPFDRDTVEYEEQSLENTWKAMECLVAAGLVKSIGVSNFNRKQVDRVMSVASIVPAVNQIEVNVDCMNTKLIDYCWSKGIHIEAYGVLGNPGFLGYVCCCKFFADASSVRTKVPPILEQPYIKEIAAAHNKTPAQILLRHGLQRGLVVLCKSVTPSRIESNFKVFDFELSEEEMKKLNTCGRNTRLFKVPALKDHPEYPHKEE